MRQEVEGIDWDEREGRDKGESGGVGRGKDGLFVEGFEGEIQLIGTSRWVGNNNLVDSVELSSFMCVSLFFVMMRARGKSSDEM